MAWGNDRHSIGEPICADWSGRCGSGNFGVFVFQSLPSPIAFFDGQYRITGRVVLPDGVRLT